MARLSGHSVAAWRSLIAGRQEYGECGRGVAVIGARTVVRLRLGRTVGKGGQSRSHGRQCGVAWAAVQVHGRGVVESQVARGRSAGGASRGRTSGWGGCARSVIRLCGVERGSFGHGL